MKKVLLWMQQRGHNLRILLVTAYFGMWILAALFPGVSGVPDENAYGLDSGYQVISVAIYTDDTAAATDEKAEKQQKVEKRKAIRESVKAFLQDFVAGDEKKGGLGLVFLASFILGLSWLFLIGNICAIIGLGTVWIINIIFWIFCWILPLAGLVGITFITTPWVRKRLPEGDKKNARLIAVMLLLGALLFPWLFILLDSLRR